MTSQIKLENFRKYIEMNDWEINSLIGKFMKIKKQFHEDLITLLIPNTEELKDYEPRMKDIIGTIAELQGKEFKDLFEEIRNIGYDLMKIKFVANKTEKGTIPLNEFIGAMKNVKNLIMFGACSEIQQKSQYKRPFNEAQFLVKNCEFAQTEVGSFVISIRVPLGKTYLFKIDDDNKYIKDLGRKTVTRIVEGIREAEELTIENEKDFIENYDKKLNRNVCQAISNILMEKEGFNVDINVKWDSTEVSEQQPPVKVEIKSYQYFKKFNQMASYLKKTPEEENITITGLIKKLQKQEVDSTTEKKIITVDVLSLKRKVYLHLNEEDHRSACNAYKEGQRIQVTGLLNKKTQHWFLDNPTKFQILPNSISTQ